MNTNDLLQEACEAFNAGDLKSAEKCYKKILRDEPNNCEVLFILSSMSLHNDNSKRAKYFIEKALTIEPINEKYILHFSSILRKEKEYEKEYNFLKNILNKIKSPELLMKLGEVLRLLLKNNKAEKIFLEVIKLEPKNYLALANLGDIYNCERHYSHAEKYYKLAICANSNFPQIYDALGKFYLKLGKYEKGWKGHEYRLQHGISNLKDIPRRWDGDKYPEATLMLICEQGFGDIIQFARFIPKVKEYFKKIKFFCQKELISLLQVSFPYCEFIEKCGKLPLDYDFHIPIMSLGEVFNIKEDTIPSPNQYLSTTNEQINKFKPIFSSKVKNIGFCWMGNLKNQELLHRAIPLDKFSTIFNYSNINFYNLRKDDTGDDITPYANSLDNVFDYTNKFNDFNDTAGFIMNLDIVITIDTSVAHLAGALGKETILLLSYNADWRWLVDRNDSPWYGSITLIRQNKINNWDSAICAVKKYLDEK